MPNSNHELAGWFQECPRGCQEHYEGFTHPCKGVTEAGKLESEENGVTSVYARRAKNGWEYAVIFWYHHSPALIAVLAGGKMEQG